MKRRSKIATSRSIAQALPAILTTNAGFTMLLLALAIIFMVISSLRPQAVEGLRMAVVDITAPVLKTFSLPMQNAAILVRDVSGLAEIQAENAMLKEENARLREWYQTALLLQAENKSFRELLNVKSQTAQTFLSVRVMGDAGNAFVNTLLISSGSEDGIRKGQAVLADKGLIGRVIEVGEKAARVLLITDINSRIPVLIEGTNQHAILMGDNEQGARLTHLSAETQIQDGVRVMTSGHGGVFPQGLPIGVINADGESGRFSVSPLANFGEIVFVRVMEQMPDPFLRRGALESE